MASSTSRKRAVSKRDKCGFGTGSGAESSYYQSHFEVVNQQNKQLKLHMEQLERENKELKAAVFHLSSLYTSALHRLAQLETGRAASAPLPPQELHRLHSQRSDDSLDPSVYTSATLPPGFADMHDLARRLDRLASKSAEVLSAAGDDGFGAASSIGSSQSKRPPARKSRWLHRKQELSSHSGSVYTAAFSPRGRFLATGSFDKTVRVWDVKELMQSEGSPHSVGEIKVLDEHQLNVSDLVWSVDASTLLSGGFDQCVKRWDVHEGRLLESYAIPGFVQSVVFQPVPGQGIETGPPTASGSTATSTVFYVGSTSTDVLAFDVRAPAKPVRVLSNDCMVNSLCTSHDGQYLLTGDAHGVVKTWATAQTSSSGTSGGQTPQTPTEGPGCVHRWSNGPSQKPISCLRLSRANAPDTSNPLLAVNSYDNILRVYEHAIGGSGGAVGATPSAAPTAPGARTSDPNRPSCLHSLSGHKNKNWPIRSSFYCGRSVQTHGRRAAHSSDGALSDDSPDGLENNIVLATGSADRFVYVYNVAGPGGSSRLMQRIEGHKDRVYSVCFHPFLPLLASCSADSTVKLWTPNRLSAFH